MSFKFDAGDLLEGLIETESKFDIAVRALAVQSALNMQNDAREQARWTDRTGHARQRLRGFVETGSKGYRIVLAHGVDYGLWLELANEKRFAIVEPIIRLSAPYIMQDFDNLMSKIGGKHE
jgi:hypothetical protein